MHIKYLILRGLCLLGLPETMKLHKMCLHGILVKLYLPLRVPSGQHFMHESPPVHLVGFPQHQGATLQGVHYEFWNKYMNKMVCTSEVGTLDDTKMTCFAYTHSDLVWKCRGDKTASITQWFLRDVAVIYKE